MFLLKLKASIGRAKEEGEEEKQQQQTIHLYKVKLYTVFILFYSNFLKKLSQSVFA
jgi:hypothetical protein